MGPPPVVTGISPKEGPPGTRVTIRGEFLGTSSSDLIGLIICGCDCLLSAEWKSKNKIVARSGPCKGRGDIIVTTKSGREGTSTVQFRGYHESIGPVKESAVWVEETAPPALPWGRRPLSPAACAPPDPLGLSTEGDDCNFPEDHLLDYFPDGSGKLTDENFQPGWYLLEHHSNTSFEDLRAGMVFLQRKVESQKEGQISFLKANTGAVMDQLDRLVLLKNMYEEDQRKSGKEPLPSLQTAIEESIAVADALFAEILARKESADRTRDALLLLTRHRFLFQLPASVDRNIRRKEFDLVVNDYSRVNNLFRNTHVQLFKKILTEIDKKIKELKENLYTRMKTMPINVQEQTKYIRLLISLNWEGDAAWVAITSRNEYILNFLNKVKDHFKNIEDQETSGYTSEVVTKSVSNEGMHEELKELLKYYTHSHTHSDFGKRKWKEGEVEGAWNETRAAWCGAACGALAAELGALWPLARRYFAGELAGEPDAPTRHNELKEMIIAAVELFASHMRVCLLSGAGGSGGAPADAVRARLAANLRNLREAYDSLLKLDLPSQPLSIVEKVIFEYRAHGMTVFLQRALHRVEGLARLETWRVRRRGAHPAVTDLPMMLETAVKEALDSIDKCVLGAGRREGALLLGKESPEALQRLARQILLAFVSVLRDLALSHVDQDFVITSLSVLLTQRVEEPAARPGWQQRLLIAGANAQYVRLVTLPELVAAFESYKLPISPATAEEAREALVQLERSISETYLEQTGDALVGTIEASMHLGRQRLPRAPGAPRASPYVYEIINNLIAVHAEVDSVCSVASATYVRAICETVCEELARLAAGAAGGAEQGAALQARLDAALLRLAARHHLTRKAENDLKEALARFPPLETEDDKKLMESLVADFKKEMELQLTCLSCNVETI